MTRPDRRHKDPPAAIRSKFAGRERKIDEAIWQIFRAVVAGGDTYVFDLNISRRKALAYWLRSEKRAVTSLYPIKGIVGSYILKANQPGLGSHVANAGFMVSPSARGRGIGRAMAGTLSASKARASRFSGDAIQLRRRDQQNSRCAFGKILDLKSSANCRALSAIAGAGLLMFL